MSLDVFTSPSFDNVQNTVQLLFVKDLINVYGYQTNTGLKIIVGTNFEVDKNSTIFNKIHLVYLNLIINPFQTEEIKINKDSLDEKILKIVEQSLIPTPVPK